MKKAKRQKIFNKVIRDSDIAKLVEIFDERSVDGDYLKIELDDSDGINYEFSSIEKSSLGAIIRDKTVVSCSFYLSKRDGSDSLLDVDLHHADQGYRDTQFRVQSKDSAWFHVAVGEIQEWVDGLKPQSNFYLSRRRLLFHATAPLIGFLLGLLIVTFSFLILWLWPDGGVASEASGSSGGGEGSKAQIVANIFYLYLGGYLCTHILFESLDKLWPSIEFDFGPDHKRLLKIRRKTLKNIIVALVSLVAIPTSITLIFRFV